MTDPLVANEIDELLRAEGITAPKRVGLSPKSLLLEYGQAWPQQAQIQKAIEVWPVGPDRQTYAGRSSRASQT